MPQPELAHSRAPIRDSDSDAILLALPPLGDENAGLLADWPGLREALTATGFTGASGSFTRTYAPDATDKPLAVVGTGVAPGAAAVRDAVGAGIRQLTGFEHVAVAIPGVDAQLVVTLPLRRRGRILAQVLGQDAVAVHRHGAELQDLEGHAALAHPCVPEQDRPLALQGDGQRHEQHGRPRDRQPEQGDDHVQRPGRPERRLVAMRLDQEGAHVVVGAILDHGA